MPIFAHALTHACFMRLALWVIVPDADWFLPIMFQVVSHFVIDVLKGRMNEWFPALQSPVNKWHWIMFGADQFFHAAAIIIMVELIIK